jgi:hypothetical protein
MSRAAALVVDLALVAIMRLRRRARPTGRGPGRGRRRSRPGSESQLRVRRRGEAARGVRGAAPSPRRRGSGRRSSGGAPTPGVVGDGLSVAARQYPLQVGEDLHPATDHARVHRVVVAVQPHVVIAGQPRRTQPSGHRRDRRRRQHRGLIGGDPVARGAPQRAARPPVHGGEPAGELGVEVRRPGEGPPGQERPLQVVMRPLDQPLGLRVPRLADQHLRPERAAEPLALGGELTAPAPVPADRALPVPDQHPRHAGTGSAPPTATGHSQ